MPISFDLKRSSKKTLIFTWFMNTITSPLKKDSKNSKINKIWPISLFSLKTSLRALSMSSSERNFILSSWELTNTIVLRSGSSLTNFSFWEILASRIKKSRKLSLIITKRKEPGFILRLRKPLKHLNSVTSEETQKRKSPTKTKILETISPPPKQIPQISLSKATLWSFWINPTIS